MTPQNILLQQIVQKLGWTLLHFIWQAAAIALLLGILLAMLRKSSAGMRYIISCAALGLIVLLPIITLWLIQVTTPQPPVNVEPAPAPVVLPVEPPEETLLDRAFEYMEMTQPKNIGTAPKIHWKQQASELLESLLPYIVTGWLLGVFGLSLWHLGGWAQLQRFKKQMVKRVDVPLQVKLNDLSGRLKVKRAVQLLESALVQVPTVVGWLRPVILLPASALTGLTAEQLEALLAHELAHIRRYDYLVNMLQTVVETLGFYHPAVWWVSHTIRIERENCCDDLAVSISGDRVRYAKALASMEEIRAGSSELAVAATGGSLFSRIRRIVAVESPKNHYLSWIPSAIAIILIVALALPTTLALSRRSSNESHGIESSLLEKLADPKVNAKGRQILRQMAEVNRYWLIAPPPKVKNYSYDFNLYDRDSNEPTQETIKVKHPAKVDLQQRQGITYDSILHKLISNPSVTIIRKIRKDQQLIQIDFIFRDFTELKCGNGISHSWRGYFSGLVKSGSLWLDAEKIIPVKVKAGWLVEYYSEYVAADKNHYVPLKVTIGNESTRFHWQFGFYEPGLWFFENATYKQNEENQPRMAASINNLKINNRPAVETNIPVVEVPELNEGHQVKDGKTSKPGKTVTLTLTEQGLSFEGQTITWDQFGPLLADVPEPENTGLKLVLAADSHSFEVVKDTKTRISILSRELGFRYLSCINDVVNGPEQSGKEQFFTAPLEFSRDIYIRQSATGQFNQKHYRTEKGWSTDAAEQHKEPATVYINSINFQKSFLGGAVSAKLKIAYDSWPKAKWQIVVRLLDSKGNSLAQSSDELNTNGYIISGKVFKMSSELDFSFGQAANISKAATFEITVSPLLENNVSQNNTPVKSDSGRIEGRIIDIDTNEGISGVQMVAVPNSSPESNERFTCTTAEDGTFSIGGLKSGEYLLQGDFPSVDVGVVSGRSTNDVLIGIRQKQTALPQKETTGQQQSNGQIMIGLRMIQMPADAVKEAFEPNENVSSGLLFRQGHEIAGRLLTIAQERKDAKLLIAPQMLLNNNSDGTISIIREEFFIHHYEPNENEPGKLAPQLKPLDVGWKFKIFAEIPGDGEQVHIKLAARRQKSDFKTLQYRPGYDYQVPSPPEIFTTDFIAKNGEPVVIGRLIGDETAYCLIVTPSLILPERQPEPLLGKKLPEPDNIQNIDSLRQAEGKRILVCFWDSQQRPSRNLVGELAKRGKELASKNIAVMLIDTSGVEPAKLKEWLDNRNIPFTCGSIKYNVKDVLIRWGVRAQPWLILTDENGIVRAEGLSLEQLDEKLQETNEPTAARTRIVHFPDDHAVGNLKVRDARPDVDWDRGYLSLPGWALLGPAQGDVNIPAGEDLRLEVSGNVTDFSFLSDLKPNDLQVLLLSDKKISDDDLVYLKGLTGLLALHLGSTPIEDKGLAHLAPLTSLKELTLFNTKVSDAGLEHLSTLKSLKRLNLFITQVRGPGLQYLQNLTLLVSLDLAATPITDVSLVHVAKITWLKELELQDTAITDRGLAHLKSLRSLEMLILGNADLRQGYSPITDDGLVYLKELDSLKDLYLLRTRVTDAGLAHLSNLKTLEALDLTETRITGEGLAYLKDLPALIHLNLEKTGVTEVGLKYLKEMTNLRVLSLDGESFYEKDLKDLEKALPDCKVTVRTAYSANSVPEVPVLSKSAVPSAEDKSIVKVDLSVVEVPSDSQVERETTKETRNMLGGKITIPDSPAVADLLRKAAGATAAVKDESAGGKRVTQKEFKTLSDLLVSRGYVKILMNPSLEVVDGQTAQIKTDQSSFDVTVESVKDDIIDLTVQAELTSQIAPANEGKKPMISRRSFASFVSINSGQSQIIGGTIQPAAHPDTEGNAKVPQTPAGEILCIVTASIIAPPADTKPQEKASVNKNQVFPECIQLKYYRASDAAQVVRPLLGKAGSVSFDQKTNIIIIIDKIENLKRIEKIITALEVSRTAQPGETKQQDKATADKEYEIIQLRHIDANEAAERIIKVLSQMPEKEFRPSVRVQPLENTGQIIIFGRKDLREIVKKLIDELDITEGHFVTQVFQLKYANPDLIKEKIEGSYKYPANEPQEAVRVIALPKTKQVTVIASPENLSRIAEQIAEWDTFDILKPRIIELQNSDPAQMVGLLTTLFAEEGGDEVNIRDVILSENIAGPLSSHFIFEDVPETSKIIVMSNIPEAYDAVGQLIFELDKQKMATKDVKQVREWIARLIKEGRLGVPKTINEVEHSEKLFKLGKALLTYANNHDGKYPDSIAQVKQYLKADEFVWAQQNVTYYGKGRTVDDPPDIHLARDNRQAVATKGTNILFNDGRVEFIKPGRQKDRSITKDKIQIDTKILTVSDEFMKYIGLDPNSVASSEGWSEYLVDSTDDSASFVIDQLHEKLLLRNVAARMRTHKDVQMLHPPGMLAKSGMKYEMHITDSEPYNVLVGPPDSNVFFVEPESKSKGKKPGTAIRLNPTLTPDGKNIELDFEWEYRRLRSIKEHTGLDGNVQKVPQIGIDRIKTPCTIPIGKTLLIAGKKIAVQKKKEPKKFGLADLPLIGGLFYRPPKAEETKNLLIMVTPTIIMVTPTTDIKALPVPPLTDPNDPLVKKLEGKFERADKQK